MKCNNCHKELIPGMRFCPYCNTKLEEVEKKVISPLPMQLKNETEEQISEIVPPLHIKEEPTLPENEPVEVSKIEIESETLPEEEIEEDFDIEDNGSDWLVAESDTSKKDDEVSDTSETSDKNNKNINKDGYYDDIKPKTEESLPVSKGEFIAKIALFIVLIIVVALFLIYFVK